MGMRGEDVKALQRAVRLRLKRKGRAYRHIDVDGEMGPVTWSAWCTVAKDIGLDHRWLTVGNQKLGRWPWRRPKRMKDREKRRLAARRKAAAARRRGPQAAIRWWGNHLNVKEQPWGSNGGPGISDWEKRFGFGRVPWCGIFLGMGLLAGGVKLTSRVAAVAFIEDDARAGRNGFRAWLGRGSGRGGDAAVIGGRGVHVEGVVKRYSWGYVTRGGNTSCEGCTGSQSNGGQSAQRNRGFAVVYGIARPAY